MPKLPSLVFPNFLFLFLLFIFVLPLPVLVISQILEERSILLDLKQQLGNPQSLSGWNASTSPCCWPGITCTDEDNTVFGISLANNNITEKIPGRICDLKNLRTLDVSYNDIAGEFPNILNCSKLESLLLLQNYYFGPIPEDIYRLSRLRYLDLSANNFYGDIPASIGRMHHLNYLFLASNDFNSTWPVEIGNLTNLEQLALAYNVKFLPASLPKELGALKKLRFLWMTETNLIGEIPESFNNLSSLEHLDLALNGLSGTIPGGLLMPKNLTFLYLYYNWLSGPIPSSVGALNLKEIDLSMNILTGRIPEGLGKLQNLTLLNLFVNQLTGEVPASISFIPTLETFKVFGNQLSGALPSEFGLHSVLRNFQVSENKLSGELPPHLCARRALLGVIASNNNLSGEVPKSLENCKTLHSFQLCNNHFSGEIPLGIWTIPSMMWVIVSENSFSGTLPSRLGRKLSRIEISDNKFSGPIPTEISSSWMNIIVLNASNNMLSGKIPVALTTLPNISVLLLDGNQFSGELPFEILSWKSLSSLNLSRNNLSGQIPEALGSLPCLNYLDLSNNQFSGQIPLQLGHLKLNLLDFSSNNLSGAVPTELVGEASEDSFLNNPNLCANIPGVTKLRSCVAKVIKPHKRSTKYVITILFPVVSSILAVTVVTVFTLFAIKHCRRKNPAGVHPVHPHWVFTPFRKLEFDEDNILPGLTSNNVIARGGSREVYRIAIGSEVVAAKRIYSTQNWDQKYQKQFMAEMEILGTIRHRNIVKLLCCVWNESCNLIVYEYMEKQSLDVWLHGRNSTQSEVLEWAKRMQIAMGAANGLYYIHEHCSPPIIHRDVKSSNILLDDEFNAKIADFGLAKMLVQQGDESEMMSTVAGSYGYIAPEYACTRKVNRKIDVYSYGVVLLELVTGKKANSMELGLAEWARERVKEEGFRVEEVVDAGIREEYDRAQVISLFRLGLLCVDKRPLHRPTMKEVCEILHLSML